MIPRAKHGGARPAAYGPHLVTLSVLVAGDIVPGPDFVQAALTECSREDCQKAITRISKKDAPTVRSAVAMVLGNQRVDANTPEVVLSLTAKTLVPPELLKRTQEGADKEDPRRLEIEDFQRSADELRIPAEHRSYVDLTKDAYLKYGAEQVRQTSVARVPRDMMDVFLGINAAPTDPTIIFAYKTCLITHILTSIALNAWGRSLGRRVEVREILPVLWGEPGAIDQLSIGNQPTNN